MSSTFCRLAARILAVAGLACALSTSALAQVHTQPHNTIDQKKAANARTLTAPSGAIKLAPINQLSGGGNPTNGVPANNNCANAANITGSGPHPFDVAMATTDGVGDPLCLSFGTNQIENDVWYNWTCDCTAGQDATISFCSATTVDTRVAVYNGATCVGPIIACNDDSCGLQSQLTWSPTPGNVYKIRVGTFPGAATGAGTFTINCSTQQGPVCTAFNPATDCQESAFEIAYNMTTFAAAESVNANVPVNSLCIQGLYFNNVPVADAFIVTVYNTDGPMGLPGTVIDTFTQGVDLIVQGPAPTGAIFVGRNVQEWNLALARPINHQGGCRWYEVRNFATGDTVFWMDGNATNGNHQSASGGAFGPDDLYICINGGFIDNQLCLGNPCPGGAPANDLCANAAPLSSGTTHGTTTCATADAVQTCSGIAISSSVWYSVTGSGNTMTVDLCASAVYDTTLEVYCGGCTNPICVAGNDDFCGLQSSVSFCTSVNTQYLVLVHGFGGASGEFDITLSDNGMSCTTPPSCAPCTGITCPSGATPEGETCGGDLNGGCNAAPTAYEPIVGNDTICGTSFSTTTTRDTDWYTVTAPASGSISVTFTADFNAIGFILDLGTPIPDPCGTITLLAQTSILPCGSGTMSAAGLTPGNTYIVFVAPAVFADIPCPSAYVLTVDQGAPSVPCCDFNNDGVVNSQDFFDFLIAFFATAPAADFNVDGVVNSQDYFDFIVCFFAPPAGCP